MRAPESRVNGLRHLLTLGLVLAASGCASQEVASLKAENARLIAASASLSQGVADTRRQLLELEKSKAALEDKCTELSALIERLRKTDTLADELAACSLELSVTKTAVEQLRKAATLKESESQRAAAEIGQLRERLRLASSELDQLRATADQTKTPAVIETKMDGEFEGWDGETVFKLANGQIWQQASYDYTYHYAYRPDVLIYKSGAVWKMRVEGVDDTISVIRLR